MAIVPLDTSLPAPSGGRGDYDVLADGVVVGPAYEGIRSAGGNAMDVDADLGYHEASPHRHNGSGQTKKLHWPLCPRFSADPPASMVASSCQYARQSLPAGISCRERREDSLKGFTFPAFITPTF